jgi:hypothetical protein
MSYKDNDGNIYRSVQDVKISSPGIATASIAGESSPNLVPIAAAGVVILAFVGFWIYRLRKNPK